MRRIGIGVIGCGAIAQSEHIPNIFSIPQAKLIAICDIDKNRLDSVGQKFSIKNRYTNYEEMLSKEKEIEAVIIATPASTHAEIVLKALKYEKCVFVEKPITTSIEDAVKIVQKSEKLKLPVMVGYQLRFLPNHMKVKDLINRNEIGEPFFLHIRAETLVIKPAETLLIDYGTHFFDLIRWYFDKAKVLSVAGMVTLNHEGTQIGASTLIRFNSGLHASVEAFWVPKFNWGIVDRSLEVLGEEGKIWTKISGPDIRIWRAKSLRDRIFGEKIILPKETVSSYVPLSSYSYRKELEVFIKSVINGTSVPVNARDGLVALRIADAALKSSSGNGKVIEISYDC